jgi:hypothetical protein
MDLSRRQFFKCVGLSSAAAAVAPAATLEGLSTVRAPQAIALASAWPRLQMIEQAIVSTYGLLDLTGTMRTFGGLIGGAPQTAYSLAEHANFMLGEVGTDEPRAVLLRLLNPQTARQVIRETESLFTRLEYERLKLEDAADIDDLRVSYMSKLSRVVARLAQNQEISKAIYNGASREDLLAQRVATWCEKLFTGRVDELSNDPLFDALRALHRMEISRDGSFSAHKQKKLLEVIEKEGFPEPAKTIFGDKKAKLLHRCEILNGEIENYIVSSRSLVFPAHLIRAAQDLGASLKGEQHYAWADFYRKRFKTFSATAAQWNECAGVRSISLDPRKG